jgi:hypothetical protein
MVVTVIALALVALLAYASRHDTRPKGSWRPQSDWRERDPRS